MAEVRGRGAPRLRQDAYVIATAEGARVIGNRGAETFGGAAIHQWISALAGRLDGTVTEAELVRGLAPEKQEMVERVVGALRERGLVRDGGGCAGCAGGLPPGGAEPGYLDSFVPDADQAYLRYRRARRVVVGEGPLVDEVLEVLARSGAAAPVRPATADGTGDEVSRALAGGAELVLSIRGFGRSGDFAAAGRDDVEAVCGRFGVPLVRAERRGRELWFHCGRGGESGWRRLDRWESAPGAAGALSSTVSLDSADSPGAAGSLDSAGSAGSLGSADPPGSTGSLDAADPPASTGPPRSTNSPGSAQGADATAAPLAPEVVAVAAGMIAMAAFRLLTGAAEPAEAATMTCLHLETLAVTTHRFLPLRSAGRPSGEAAFLDSVSRLTAAPPLDPAALDTAGVRLLDARLGVLGDVSERDFVQLPLNVSAATAAGWGRPVTGAGLSVARARWRAVLGAVTAYAVSTVDTTRLVDGEVRAFRLADGTARLLDPAAVFATPGADTVGAAAGHSWAEAVTAGLLEVCARRTAEAPGRPVRLDPAALAPGSEATAYLRMLDILGVPPTVYDVTGPLGVPTLAFCSADRTLAYVSAPHAADALAAGLRATVLAEQSRRSAQPAYAPPPVPRLDTTTAAPGSPRPPRTRHQILTALIAAGLDPVVIPLDHDPEMTRIMPFAVRVVCADA